MDAQSILIQLDRLTVPRLKTVLRSLGEKVGGNRSDLIARLQFVVQQRSNGPPERLQAVAKAVCDAGTNIQPPPTSGMHPIARTYPPANSIQANTVSAPSVLAKSQSFESLKFRGAPFYELCDRIHWRQYPCTTGQISLQFTLSKAQLARLHPSATTKEILLLLIGPADGTPVKPNPFKMSGIPIEYPRKEGVHANAPNHCLIFANGIEVNSTSYAGIRGKPWTAKPLELNTYISKVSSGINTIQAIFTASLHSVAVAIQFAKPVAISNLVLEHQRDHTLSKDVIVAEMLDKQRAADDDICLTEEHVSLKDPVTRSRIHVPARGKQCRHPQCFDLEYYLRLNHTHPTWTCPVCSKLAPLYEVFVDGYFLDLLKEAASDLSIESAEIGADGNWRLNRDAIVEGVGDSDSEDDVVATKKRKLETSEKKPSTQVLEVIDLISDDESAPAPKRPRTENGQPSNSVLVNPALSTATTTNKNMLVLPTSHALANSPDSTALAYLPPISSEPSNNLSGTDNMLTMDSIHQNSLFSMGGGSQPSLNEESAPHHSRYTPQGYLHENRVIHGWDNVFNRVSADVMESAPGTTTSSSVHRAFPQFTGHPDELSSNINLLSHPMMHFGSQQSFAFMPNLNAVRQTHINTTSDDDSTTTLPPHFPIATRPRSVDPFAGPDTEVSFASIAPSDTSYSHSRYSYAQSNEQLVSMVINAGAIVPLDSAGTDEAGNASNEPSVIGATLMTNGADSSAASNAG